MGGYDKANCNRIGVVGHNVNWTGMVMIGARSMYECQGS